VPTYPVTLFAQNLLESGTVTSSSTATGYAVTRLYDRDRSQVWKAASAVAVDIEIDLGTAQDVGGLALVGHNFPDPTTLDLYYGASSPANTLQGSPAVGDDPYSATFAAVSARYWRLHIPVLTGSVVPELGELMLGDPQVLTWNPSLDRIQKIRNGNVQRDESPAGYTWAVRKGIQRIRWVYGWNAVGEDDRTALATAFAALDDGAKKFVLVDDEGTTRWVIWRSTSYAEVPLGNSQWQIPEIIFEDAP
jgi:hypothetical protein